MPQADPLRDFFSAYRPTEKELRELLNDSADEAERLIPKLMEKNNISGKLRAAQLANVLKEMHVQQGGFWKAVSPLMRTGIEASVKAAMRDADATIKGYLTRNGLTLPGLEASLAAQARQGFKNAISKGLNGIPLSSRVYKTQQWANGLVDKRISVGLLLGQSARELAKAVRDMIRPDVRGGVSYAAQRLARTELNNAFHTTAKQRMDEPWATGVTWHLSGSHPRRPGKPEACELLARQKHAADNVPGKPHPQCLCFITQDVVDEDTFLDSLLRGDYDDHLARQNLDRPQPVAPRSPFREAREDPKEAVKLAQRKRRTAAKRAKETTFPVNPNAAPPPTPRPTLAEVLGSLLPIHVFTDGIFTQSFQRRSDPAGRAGALWSESHGGKEALRQAMRNLRSGKDVLEGTNTRRFRFDVFRDKQGGEAAVDAAIKEGRSQDDVPSVFTEQDFRNDLHNSARIMEAKLAHGATVHKGTLYRGIRMKADALWAEGDTWEGDIVSWTEERNWAEVYAMTEDNSTGHIGDVAVIIKLRGGHSVNIDDIAASGQAGSKEHLTRGQYRVVKVQGRGKKRIVTVEEVGRNEEGRYYGQAAQTTAEQPR